MRLHERITRVAAFWIHAVFLHPAIKRRSSVIPVRQQQTDNGRSGFVARGILVGHCGPWVCAPTRSAMRRLAAGQLLMEGNGCWSVQAIA